MNTPASVNLAYSYDTLVAKLAEAAASLKPSVTVDGVVIDRAAYITALTDRIEAVRKLKVAARKPFFVRSRHRG